MFGAAFLLQYTREPLILYGSRWVVILVYVTLMLPFTTRMQMSGMLSLGDTYIEASRVSGAGSLRTDVKILLPLLRPTLGGAAALMFVMLTHEFSASLLVRSSTMQTMGTALYDFWSNGFYPEVAAIALGDDRRDAVRRGGCRSSSGAPAPSASSDAVGGLHFGLTAFCTDRSATPADVAVAVEAAGFAVLLFPDHTHVPVSRTAVPFPGGGDLPEHYCCAKSRDPWR